MRRHNIDNIFSRLTRKPLRSNTVNPDIVIDPIWLRDEPPAVEIIELDSSNEELSPTEPNHSRSHAWSYVNDEEIQQIENSYKINKLARERCRLQNKNPNSWSNDVPNNFHKNYSDTHIEETFNFGTDMNCFGLINKRLVDTDTSTDGEFGEVEIITSDDRIMGGGSRWDQDNNDLYNEEIITYDTALNQETRTIWIYSFKNKHLLTENDFEALTYKENSNSSYSTDSSGEQKKDASCRIGSPTTTYIPRLDLSLVPTLSTVVEMSECNLEVTPSKSVKSTSRINKMRVSESIKDGRRSVCKHDKSTSIINWMCLSPRERRRVVKENVVSDTWISSCLNLSEVCTDDNRIERLGDQKGAKKDEEQQVIEVKAEVHVGQMEANGDSAKTISNSINFAVKANTDDLSSINKIKYADAANEVYEKDRGDHDVKLVAPVIRLTPKHRKSYITDPIDKLDTSKWIYDKDENETMVYDYVLNRSESILGVKNTANSVDHIWMKNTVPFLKPSHWTEFKPIADSPVTCHISISSIEERKTWFERLINFLRCCK